MLAFLFAPTVFAQGVVADGGVRLKLDWDLVPRIGTPGATRSKLLAASAPEIRGRILKIRDQVAALDQSNAEKVAFLNRQEGLIRRMNGVVAAQEKIIARLAAEAKRPKTKAVARAPVPKPRPVTLPAPQASTMPAPIHLGPIELPGILRNHVLEGALGGVIVILLGWALYLRSVARSRTAELIILQGGSTATPTPEPDEDLFADIPDPEPEPAPPPPPPPPPPKAERPRKREAPAPAGKPPRAKRSDSDTAPELEWSETVVRHKASDPDALSEVDTLIAEGDDARARQLLTELMKNDRDNPEYRLRYLHVESNLDDMPSAAESKQLLMALHNGPLFAALSKLKDIGQGFPPGHSLFENDAKLEEAKQILHGHDSGQIAAQSAGDEPQKPLEESTRRQAPPLILDLEVDDETIDFFTDLSFDGEDEKSKKG